MATQTYPNSKYFLDTFEKATNNKYGIIDLHSNTREKDSFMEDGQFEEKVPALDKSSSIPSRTQVYSQQLQKQKNALNFHGR